MAARIPLIALAAAVLIGCGSDGKTRPAADGGRTHSDNGRKTDRPAADFTHVVTAEAACYTTGPQQGRPPDGRFPAGTKVEVLREAGSYLLVRSRHGVEAYVSTAALQKHNGEPAVEITPEVKHLAESNNSFALELYGQLAGKEPGNLFFSPVSISTALAMTYAGAGDRTQKGVAGVLHFELPEDQLHAAFGSLNDVLNRSGGDQGFRLSVANRLWGQEAYGFRPDFLAVTREHHGAELAQVDFARRSESARQEINEWVAEQTAGKIPSLIPVRPTSRG